MNKILFSIFLGLFFLISLFLNHQVYAIYVKRDICRINEIENSCFPPQSALFPHSGDLPLCPENDPALRYVGGDPNSVAIYCKRIPILSTLQYQTPKYLPLLLIALLIEIPVFLIFGFRSKKALLYQVAAIFISTLLLYIAFPYIFPFLFSFSPFGLTLLTLILFPVIIFENIFLTSLSKRPYSRKKILFIAILTSIISLAIILFSPK